MINSFAVWLKKPFYTDNSFQFRLRQAALFGLFVGAFLFIFRPFQIDVASVPILNASIFFGGVTLLSMMVLNILIPRIFSGFFNDELWNISKEIFWNIINISVIGLFNYLIFIYLYTSTFSWSGIIWFQFVTLSIGILPVSIGILVKEQRERKKYEEDAAEMLPPLKSQELSNQSGAQNHIITIPSLNQEEPFVSEISDLLFIKSADNYIEIIHSKDESISRVMLRNTLKNLESELQPFDMLFRCHKSYLINLDKVLRISGNAQGFKFHIDGFDQAIPVSRQHNELVKKRFAIRP